MSTDIWDRLLDLPLRLAVAIIQDPNIQDPNNEELIRDGYLVLPLESCATGGAEARAKASAEAYATGFAEAYATGFAEAYATGIAEGALKQARVVLHKVLAARALAVTSAAQVRIQRESDVSRLERWIVAAVHADSIRDVFGRRASPRPNRRARSRR